MVSFGGTSEQSANVFSAKIFFPPIHKSFLLWQWLCYGDNDSWGGSWPQMKLVLIRKDECTSRFAIVRRWS